MPEFRMTDQETIVIGVVDRTRDADVPIAELKTTDLFQLAAGRDAFILGLIFLFTIAAWGRNHFSPRFLMGTDPCFP
jgi:hypothetical protein